MPIRSPIMIFLAVQCFKQVFLSTLKLHSENLCFRALAHLCVYLSKKLLHQTVGPAVVQRPGFGWVTNVCSMKHQRQNLHFVYTREGETGNEQIQQNASLAWKKKIKTVTIVYCTCMLDEVRSHGCILTCVSVSGHSSWSWSAESGMTCLWT